MSAGSERTSPNPALVLAATASGLALAVGSFLDAYTVRGRTGRGPLRLELTVSFIDGDGPITLGLGVVVVALAVLVGSGVLRHRGGYAIGAVGTLGALAAVSDIFDVKDRIDPLRNRGLDASYGPALWVCLVGGVAAVVFGILLAATRPPRRDEPLGWLRGRVRRC